MLLRQLEYFIQICLEGSFTKAADVLRVSQPTLSQQIRLLEQEYEAALFHRVGRGVVMTEAGKLLLEKSTAVMRLLEESRKEIADLNQNQRNDLIIGMLPGDLTYLLPRLYKFQEQHPQFSLNVVDLEDPEKQLLQHKIDFGISPTVPKNDRFVRIPLFREELMLVISEDHPWAGKTEIPFCELAHLQTVLFIKDAPLRKQILEAAKQSGISLHLAIEESSTSTLLDMVNYGAGATILSHPLVASYHCPTIKLIRLKNPNPSREITVYYSKDMQMASSTKAFIRYLPDLTRDI